jgi:hypothetical protein
MRLSLYSVLAVGAFELRMQYETPLRSGGLNPEQRTHRSIAAFCVDFTDFVICRPSTYGPKGREVLRIAEGMPNGSTGYLKTKKLVGERINLTFRCKKV